MVKPAFAAGWFRKADMIYAYAENVNNSLNLKKEDRKQESE